MLSPRSIQGVDWEGRRVEVSLRRQQVEGAPPIAADEPVSRQMDLTREQVKSGPEYSGLRLSRDDEQLLHRHYQRPGYWDNVLF